MRGPLRNAIEAIPLRLQNLERHGDLVRDVIEPGRVPRVYRVHILRSGVVYVPVDVVRKS
ncbi:hypothetical protein ASG60_08400 [Methylobacterium sp. Leaf469]|uniref:hypothetical protein n=1 Tax=Methylobacterium sp. Leaf469 TaxID=1736387 RepID=UPI000712C3EC|nr:hypothetical protein [Methylobacterium sp. Leaf469]KQT93376.1 hypothetical protein ASG60_08400 [Methylobacterium sp. Leaf469]